MKTLIAIVTSLLMLAGCASSTKTEKSETTSVTTTIDTTVTIEIPEIADTLQGDATITPDEIEIVARDTASNAPVITVRHNRKTKETIVNYQPPPQQAEVKATQETKVEKKEATTETQSWMDDFKWLLLAAAACGVVVIGVIIFLRRKS
jgi:hypothetical protein